MRGVGRDPIRGGHYGQRSCDRIKRPNTWLHRPMLQNREESSCQTGAVHTWRRTDMPTLLSDVRCRGQTGSGWPTVEPARLTRIGHKRVNPACGSKKAPTQHCVKTHKVSNSEPTTAVRVCCFDHR